MTTTKIKTMSYWTKQLTIIILFLTASQSAFSQTINDSIKKKIDDLFVKWDNPSSPGCSIGIVRNDSLIYTKGFGMANVLKTVPYRCIILSVDPAGMILVRIGAPGR